MEERQRGREGKREREREREKEREKGGRPMAFSCPWVSVARLVLPLVPWLESAVHTY